MGIGEAIAAAVFITIAIAIAVAFAGYIIYILAAPTTGADYLRLSATHVCATSDCLQLVEYSVTNGYDGTVITITAFKDGTELPLSPVLAQTGGPFNDELVFNGVDPRLFAGPGEYELEMRLSGHLGGALSRGRGIVAKAFFTALAVGENTVPFSTSTSVSGTADERRELVFELPISANRAGDTVNQRGEKVFPGMHINCKHTVLKAITLRSVDQNTGLLSQEQLDGLRENGIILPEDDRTYDQPIDIHLQMKLADGTVTNLGAADQLGRTFQLPAPVEMTQDIVFEITRRSGQVPFFPITTMSIGFDLTIECLGS